MSVRAAANMRTNLQVGEAPPLSALLPNQFLQLHLAAKVEQPHQVEPDLSPQLLIMTVQKEVSASCE